MIEKKRSDYEAGDTEAAFEEGYEVGYETGLQDRAEGYEEGYAEGLYDGETNAREAGALRPEELADHLRREGLSHLDGMTARWDAVTRAFVFKASGLRYEWREDR